MDTNELNIYENLKRVYICHPYRNDPVKNVKKVEQIVIDIGLASAESHTNVTTMERLAGTYTLDYPGSPWGNFIVPVAPMTAFPMGMSEVGDKPITDEQGMAFCFSLLFSCHELWIYAKTPTSGMIQEIEAASRWSIPVIWKV